MAAYKPLYTIRIEHDYFDNNVCRAIQCLVSPSGRTLLERRGLLFRRISANEWEILYDSAGGGIDTDSDILLLELKQCDPLFVLYTRWDGFRPDFHYCLELPAATEISDAAQVIREIARVQAIGSGFCHIQLHLTEDILRKAQAGKPAGCILPFHAPKRRWEFMLFMRDDGLRDSPGEFLIEEQAGRLHFRRCEVVNEYGRNALCSVSEEFVPMHEHYDFKLNIVYMGRNSGQNRIHMRNIPHPEPGRFLSNDTELLRHVCNI